MANRSKKIAVVSEKQDSLKSYVETAPEATPVSQLPPIEDVVVTVLPDGTAEEFMSEMQITPEATPVEPTLDDATARQLEKVRKQIAREEAQKSRAYASLANGGTNTATVLRVNESGQIIAPDGYSQDYKPSMEEVKKLLDAAIAAMSVKAPSTRSPKLTEEQKAERLAEREAKKQDKLAEQEAAIAKVELENQQLAERLQSEMTTAIGEAKSLEEIQALIKQFAPQVKAVKVSKSGKVGTGVYKDRSLWAEGRSLKNDREAVISILEMHNSGMKNSAIAKAIGCTPTYIYRILGGQLLNQFTGLPKSAKAITPPAFIPVPSESGTVTKSEQEAEIQPASESEVTA